MNKLIYFAVSVAVGMFGGVASSSAAGLDQYATSVIAFSSQFTATSWSAAQATGAPNVASYGDNALAWAPLNRDGTSEFITLGYATPVYAYAVTVRETLGNGFVTSIELLDESNVWHVVWNGIDTSLPTTATNFVASWAPTTYKTQAVRVTINTNLRIGVWEEIDSVQLSGFTTNATPGVFLRAPDNVGSESFSSPGLFVVSRAMTSLASPLTVGYTISGTATNGSDYNNLTGSVTIPAGSSSVALPVVPINDALQERSETVTVVLRGSALYQVAGKFRAGTVTITSDE